MLVVQVYHCSSSQIFAQVQFDKLSTLRGHETEGQAILCIPEKPGACR